MRFCLTATIALSCLSCYAGEAAEESIERWDRTVCLIESRTDVDGKESGDAGSAFVVACDEDLMLISAGHVARFTTAKSRILYRDCDGKSNWIVLGGLTDGDGEPWRYHQRSDLAVMRLHEGKVDPEAFASLSALAIPIEKVMTDVPDRMTAIEITGFPMLLGVDPAVSPLVMQAHVASREMPVAADWGQEQIVFAHPFVGHGTSGGPTFLSTESPTDVDVMGICIGYMRDKAGSRLAKLVPGRLIVDLVKQHAAAEDP